jgi:4-hydroxybenzoate polyprenyltransferase
MNGRARSSPRARDAWAVLRVRQWLVFVPLPAAGIARLDEVQGARMGELVAAAVVSSLALAYAYGINAIFDRRADRDPDKNVLAGREGVPLAAVVSVTCAGLAALVGAGAVSAGALGAIAISIAAGTVYSAGLRLKRFPLAGLAANLLIFAPLMFTAVRPGHAPGNLGLLVLAFGLLVTQNQILHEEADSSEDEAAGALTTARWLGRRGARWAFLALAAGVAAVGARASAPAGVAVSAVGALATVLVGLCDRPAAQRRRAHRYLAASIGVALFLASLWP